MSAFGSGRRHVHRSPHKDRTSVCVCVLDERHLCSSRLFTYSTSSSQQQQPGGCSRRLHPPAAVDWKITGRDTSGFSANVCLTSLARSETHSSISHTSAAPRISDISSSCRFLRSVSLRTGASLLPVCPTPGLIWRDEAWTRPSGEPEEPAARLHKDHTIT